MQYVFVLKETAVTVSHWYEVGEQDEEHGARVEVRALQQTPQRESMSASQLIVIDQVIFRADLFDLVGDRERPGNMKRAHYHTLFIGNDPDGRQWSRDLSANDPFQWLTQQLSALSSLAAGANFQLHDPEAEIAELEHHLPEIVDLARQSRGEVCTSAEACLDRTRHSRDTVLQQMSELRPQQPSVDPRVASLTSSAR